MFDLHPSPTGNGYLIAIEARNMYKMPLKLDNPLLDMILSQKLQLIDKKCTKLPIFTVFDLRYALKMDL